MNINIANERMIVCCTKSMRQDNKTSTIQDSTTLKPIRLDWSCLSKTVQTSSGPRCILHNVSGSASPGQILALMGPSGCGKTSLLNVLSGRNNFDSGTLSINGKQATRVSIKKLKSRTAFVKQSDVFFEQLTVKDQLFFTALLRLPSKYSSHRKALEVQLIIEKLSLHKCANSKIALLSGGEKKRVNIGTELLTNPNIIMLDEPTSGLDSASSVKLIKMLQQLASHENKTILTSIHQPSSATFQSFDKLLMLVNGVVAFFGTPSYSLSFLAQNEFHCPDGYNASDYWMDLLVSNEEIDEDQECEQSQRSNVQTDDLECQEVFCDEQQEEGDGQSIEISSSFKSTIDSEIAFKSSYKSIKEIHRSFTKLLCSSLNDYSISSVLTRSSPIADIEENEPANTPKFKLIKKWKDHEEDTKSINRISISSDAEEDENINEKKYATSWWTQFSVLSLRSFKISTEEVSSHSNNMKIIAIAFVVGLLWFQLDNTEKDTQDRASYLFFALAYWILGLMFESMGKFPAERNIIFKERASGSYHLSAYFLAKTASDIPARIFGPFLYMSISYWLATPNNKFLVFVSVTLTVMIALLTGESIGLLIGASLLDVTRATNVTIIASLLMMLVGGFYIKALPSFCSWLIYLSPFKYAYHALLTLVFDEDVPCDGSGMLFTLCGGNAEAVANKEDVLKLLHVQGSVGFNIAMLFVFTAIFRVGAFYALRKQKVEQRM